MFLSTLLDSFLTQKNIQFTEISDKPARKLIADKAGDIDIEINN